MLLILSQLGEKVKIKKIIGNSETKRFLKSLGFVIGEGVTIVSDLGGNLIVSIKDTRIALDKEIASKIIV
ncbi:FeoA family protein [Clostridium sp.]|uniref:FeoA family protein n=1 Tax=Clostridium sp. TaxID=1506 RepID=UPI0025C09B74|nr:FeoA family protein [Clostridium sp.]MCI9069684.1 ferrous iron transport protein A [Clostridium sp.]